MREFKIRVAPRIEERPASCWVLGARVGGKIIDNVYLVPGI